MPLSVALSWLNGMDTVSDDAGSHGVQPRSELRVGIEYERRSRRSLFAVAAESGASVEPHVELSTGVSQQLSMSMSAQLSRRTTLQASIDASYAPMNLADQLSAPVQLGPASVTSFMPNVEQGHERRAAAIVSVTRTLGRRSSAVFAYSYDAAALAEGSAASMQLASLRFSRQVSPFAAFRAGYGVGYGQAGVAGVGEAERRQDIELGMHYERPLPFSGRTIVSMNTGTSVFRDGTSQRLRLMAQGSLAHSFSGRWAARLDYSRPVQFLAGVADPLFSDTIGASINGRTSRRTEVAFTAGYSRGAVGFESAATEFDSRSVTAQFRARVARAWWLEIQAFTGAYSFSSGELLADSLPPAFTRHGVRGGVSWSAPVRP
jgi:hypothetical protein